MHDFPSQLSFAVGKSITKVTSDCYVCGIGSDKITLHVAKFRLALVIGDGSSVAARGALASAAFDQVQPWPSYRRTTV